ncbi:MAG: SpaA isopeptide-forming pilin-related protein [Slackia sp.]|nr:SpaA isopeptide-forming pilin-related protein [Slackia sp.]
MSNSEISPCTDALLSRREAIVAGAGSALASFAALSAAHASETPPKAPQASIATMPLDAYLGATRSMVNELEQHRDDSYYLSTPFGNTGPNGEGGPLDTWDCWHPLGKPNDDGESYMNCTGFIVAAMEACGADCDIVGSYVGSTGYDRGNKANLSRWRWFLEDHAAMKTSYSSKEELLASGALHKGDLIIAEPNDWTVPGADGHVMVFWGDDSSEDLAWHSTEHADGVIAGSLPGNVISRITAKHGDCFWMHVPLAHDRELTLRKRSADLSVTDGTANDAYSLAEAQFSLFETYENGTLDGFIASFTTDAEGKATVRIPQSDFLWVREDVAPRGFLAWDEPRKIAVADKTAVDLEDRPCLSRLIVKKVDAQTGAQAQGHATLEGAVFELVDANGHTHSAHTSYDAKRQAFVAVFEEIVCGKARIRESQAPTGYLPQTDWVDIALEGSSEEHIHEMPLHICEETPVRGDICGAKYRGDSQGDTKDPLAGCSFALWLQDDGTLSAKGYVVEAIVDGKGAPVCSRDGAPLNGALIGTVESHDDGRFTSKDLLEDWNPDEHNGAQRPRNALPYGLYTLVETHCPDAAYELIEPIVDIQVAADGQEVFFIIEDDLIASPVRIVKIDADSGKPIAKAGTEIALLRKNDNGSYERVEFETHYPDEQRITSFVVPQSGIVQFPEKLAQGSYAIQEIKAVPPYTLRSDPVYFEVDAAHDWGDSDIIEIELPNEAAQGCIEAHKIDEENGAAVAGAAYEVRAKDDVKTPDGTLHHKAGEIVGTPVTDDTGSWRIEGLSLGMGSATYIVKETASPDGYVHESFEREVTLSYESDAVDLVLVSVEIEEAPCKAIVHKQDVLTKTPIEGVEIALYRSHAQEESNEVEESPVETATTDENGDAVFLRMMRGKTYRFVETTSRIDLGYPTQHCEQTLYLSDAGLWYDSEEHTLDETAEGRQEALVEFENDCSKVVFHKVDAAARHRASSEDECEAICATALLSGGSFRLKDAQGSIIPLQADGGESIENWQASADAPVCFTHLAIGETYTIEEIEPPEGYRGRNTSIDFTVEDTLEIQHVVMENEQAPSLAKTSDSSSTLASIGAVASIGGMALAWYSHRRATLESKPER